MSIPKWRFPLLSGEAEGEEGEWTDVDSLLFGIYLLTSNCTENSAVVRFYFNWITLQCFFGVTLLPKQKKSCRMVEAHLTHLIGNLFLLTWCLHINENFHVLFVEKIPISSIYYYCLWIGLWHPVYGLLLAWNSSTISFSPGHLPDLCKCLMFDPYPWEIPLIHVMATLHYCSIIKDL